MFLFYFYIYEICKQELIGAYRRAEEIMNLYLRSNAELHIRCLKEEDIKDLVEEIGRIISLDELIPDSIFDKFIETVKNFLQKGIFQKFMGDPLYKSYSSLNQRLNKHQNQVPSKVESSNDANVDFKFLFSSSTSAIQYSSFPHSHSSSSSHSSISQQLFSSKLQGHHSSGGQLHSQSLEQLKEHYNFDYLESPKSTESFPSDSSASPSCSPPSSSSSSNVLNENNYSSFPPRKIVTFQPEAMIFPQKSSLNHIYRLVSGTVRLEKVSPTYDLSLPFSSLPPFPPLFPFSLSFLLSFAFFMLIHSFHFPMLFPHHPHPYDFAAVA